MNRLNKLQIALSQLEIVLKLWHKSEGNDELFASTVNNLTIDAANCVHHNRILQNNPDFAYFNRPPHKIELITRAEIEAFYATVASVLDIL